MASKQKTRFAVLGMLSWTPMSGYDIKKLVDAGLSHFWSENYGQLYPTLDRLVKEKLAAKKEQRTSGKRRRFVYTITNKGRQAFEQWLREPTSTPAVRNEIQLKFFLSGNLPAKESVRLIKEYQAQQKTMLAEYRMSEAVLGQAIREQKYSEELVELLDATTSTSRTRLKQCKIFFLTLRHGIRVIEARSAWCAEALAMLES